MPEAFELLFLVTVGYRNIMPYPRVGGNKHYGFGALVNCRVAAFWFFYYREADSSLALIGV